MLRDIKLILPVDKRAFTLVETITSTVIVMLILLSVWSVYSMGWKWWHEMEPIVDAQRIARVALSSIIDGTMDSTAGSDTINGNGYGLRNGIAWTTLTNEDYTEDSTFTTPVISNSGHRIDYKLEKDGVAVNGRAYYTDTDTVTGAMAVYYRDSGGAAHKIKGTEIRAGAGSISLTFEKDADGYSNLIKVTVSVQKIIPGTKFESSPMVFTCSDFAYCRNL